MIRIVTVAFLTLGLTACSVGPDYTASKKSFFTDWFAPASLHVSNEKIEQTWWRVFNDPLLETYIQEAVKNNNDVKSALANIKRARALRGENRAAFAPQINSDGSAERTKSSDAVSNSTNGGVRNLYDIGFDASWELDVFGGNRRAVEASDARLDSAKAGYQDVMLSTLSDVARNYYEARGLQKRIATMEENANLLQKTFDMINTRLKAGEASSFDVSRAKGEYQLTRARIPNLKADLHASVFTLSVLLGQPPETLLAEMIKVKPLPTPPDIVPVGLRSDILRRRPDVRQAERELAASVADIGVETSDLFPKFFVTGNLGSQARVFGDVFSAAGGLWSLGSVMQWSVFDGGAIRARVKAKEAESEMALAVYENIILNALADAETALTRYGQELETRKRLEQGVKSHRESVALANELFDSGEEDYLSVLDAERQLVASEDDLIISETASITKLIALYATLGGGWETF